MIIKFQIAKCLINRKIISILIFFAFTVINPYDFSLSQEVKTKVIVYSDIFLTESGLLPLSDNAIELEIEFSIPSDHFKIPNKITSDSIGNIYVTDKYKGIVFKFNADGEFLLQIGKKGKGKKRFLAPNNIFAEKDILIIQDTEKKSLEYLNFTGNYLKSLKISEVNNIVCERDGLLFVTPIVQDKKTPLVKVYSSRGKLLYSFGKPLSFHHSMEILNSRTMALNEKGELFIAFSYFPIVRKYSSRGTLLAEFRIKNLIMEAKERYNLKKIGEGITNMISRVGYKNVIVDIETFKNKIYLLSHYPRLEILEIEEDGKITVTYWKDFQEVYETNDFCIQEIDGEKRFYVVQSSPEYDVDVFKAKTKKTKVK